MNNFFKLEIMYNPALIWPVFSTLSYIFARPQGAWTETRFTTCEINPLQIQWLSKYSQP